VSGSSAARRVLLPLVPDAVLNAAVVGSVADSEEQKDFADRDLANHDVGDHDLDHHDFQLARNPGVPTPKE